MGNKNDAEGFDEIFLPKPGKEKQQQQTHSILKATPVQAIYKSPSQLEEQNEPELIGKSARFLNIGKKGIKITREHVHTPVKLSIYFCSDCGNILGGGVKKK